MTELELRAREWTKPINNQYPRPWTSRMTDPESARVFIVGRNPATEFPVDLVGSHEVFLDALFNRNGQFHEELYLRVRAQQGKGPSPTHTNMRALVAALNRTGIHDVLATNVICYGTPMSADLTHARHRGAKPGES